MTALKIRRAKRADIQWIVRFSQGLAGETEGKTLDQSLLEAGIAGMLDNEQRGFYLLAELDGTVVGQLAITFEWSDWRNGMFWWIQSVYVDPAARRQGVYSALYRQVVELGKQQGDVCGIRLYTDHQNHRAQAAYEKLGMRAARYRMYEVDWVLDN